MPTGKMVTFSVSVLYFIYLLKGAIIITQKFQVSFYFFKSSVPMKIIVKVKTLVRCICSYSNISLIAFYVSIFLSYKVLFLVLGLPPKILDLFLLKVN